MKLISAFLFMSLTVFANGNEYGNSNNSRFRDIIWKIKSFHPDKLLVITGSKHAAFSVKTEVIDLSNPDNICEPLVDFPFGTSGGTGVLYQEKYPLICGGYVWPSNSRPVTNECQLLGQEQGKSFHLQTGREWASSLLIDQTVMWVTGGLNHKDGEQFGTKLASTEYISLTETETTPGPDLPIHVWGHCIMPTEEGALLIGGVSDEHFSSPKTFIFDSASESWREVIAKVDINRATPN